jgi:SHS2 domain-containing protein
MEYVPMNEPGFGFEEIEHTADWALHVWAPDQSILFSQSAVGMYWLMQTSLQAEPRVTRAIDLEGGDHESLLVSFLSELLYIGEMEGLGFDRLDVKITGPRLHAQVEGAPIAEIKKEIKAVTYHNLAILSTSRGYEVTIVFDV